MKRFAARIALLVTLALVATKAKARNPLVSVFKIKQKFGMWMLHMQFAEESIRGALDLYFEGMDLSLLSEPEIHQKMLEYAKETVTILIDEEGIELSNADLKVEKGRVDIMWTLNGIKSDMKWVDIRIKTCSELEQHSNVLRFELKNTLHNYVLSDVNNFAVSFQV